MSKHMEARGLLEASDVDLAQALASRPARAPDYAAENRALGMLAEELANNPAGVAQRLAELVQALCGAGSAGISVLERGDGTGGGEVFRWIAASGAFAGELGTSVARAGSPCAEVVDGNALMLLRDPARSFPQLRGIEPPVVETLLAPWSLEGGPAGTVWVVSHDPARRFDAEDARVLRSLAGFAAAACQAGLARAAAEEALRDADRRKDEFLATLAHELRNPLAPISNAVHLLRRPDGRRSADRMVEMVGRQVRQIVRLVDDLMDVSRITQGKLELRKEPVSLTEVLSMAVETSMPAIDAGRHELTVSLPEETLMLDADKVRMTQVFANLLDNAAKYTDRGGRIWLGVRRDGRQVLVSVRDNGIGIPTDQLPGVFEMFSQAHRDSARGQAGLGIGLTMVRSLIEMHGGSVEVRSEGARKGTEFLVRLPLLAPAEQAPACPAAGGEAPPLEGRRVLVVDDNGDAAESLALLLNCAGAEVRTANDGPAALEAVSGFAPHAVLLDLGMPGMDGFEVARRLRAQPALAGLEIIALTGWGQEEDRRRTRSCGFDHHLTKPVDIDQLLDLLVHAKPEQP